MYACVHETGGGFFGAVCTLSDQARISSDPPHPSIRELLWEIRSSWLIGLGLCTIADMDFREYTFDVAW